MCRLLLLPVLIVAAAVVPLKAQSDFEFTVTRDLKSPMMHVFDPASVTREWISEQPYEMPEPSGGSEEMRHKVDAERSRRMRPSVQNRNNYTPTPTHPESITPVIENGYFGGSGAGTPNDNFIAVGNDGWFINVLNTVIRAHKPDGTIARVWNLENFINPPNQKIDPIPALKRVYDPRVLYDPNRDRYMVLFMEGTSDTTSMIIVGFSSTSNPVDPWYVYRIPGKPTQDLIWSDYPIVAHNTEDLFFTVNLIGNGATWEEGFTEAVIWQLRKEDGFNGDSLHKNVYTGIRFKNQSLRSICSIQNGPRPEGTDNYFVTVRPLDEKNDTVFLLRITNTQKSGQATLEMKLLKTDMPYGFPPSALQPDTSYKLRTNDARTLSGIRTGNTIQYLQNSVNFKTYQAHLTHSFIYNIDGDPVIRGGMITDDSLDMGYPAIASTGNSPDDESAIIAFVYSSPWHYPGTAMIYRNRYGEYSNILKVKKGESLIYYSFIPKGEQRWGDYSGIQWKYNEKGVFYLVGSYGLNSYMNAWIARIRLTDSLWEQPVSEIRVFPVPARDLIYTEIRVREEGTYEFSLYDMNGREVETQIPVYLKAGTHLFRINASDKANGIYVLRMKKEGKIIHSEKVVIE